VRGLVYFCTRVRVVRAVGSLACVSSWSGAVCDGSRVGVSAVCFVRVSLWAFPTPRLQLELRHAGGSAKKKGRAESLEEIPPEPSDGRNHSTKFLLNGPGRNHSKKFLLYPRMGGITQRNPSCTNVFLGPGRKHLKNFLLYPRMGGIPQRNSSCTETSWPGGGGNNTGNGGQTGPRQGPRSGCRTASGR
jgi:hypothetical protein